MHKLLYAGGIVRRDTADKVRLWGTKATEGKGQQRLDSRRVRGKGGEGVMTHRFEVLSVWLNNLNPLFIAKDDFGVFEEIFANDKQICSSVDIALR